MTNTQRTMINEINDKSECLAKYLEAKINEITLSNVDECLYEFGDREYLVLTEDEAYERAYESIKDLLWAFKPSFLTPFMHGLTSLSDKDFEQFEETLKDMQGRMCESCNPIITMMIKENLDKLIQEAISCDGVSHFLNTYDGKEHEQGNFFIYRTN